MNFGRRLFRKTGGIFYGWWVVTAGTLLYFLGIGSVFYGFSAFFNPMIAEFGWSRAVTSGAYSLSRLEGGVEGPIVGWLIDRFGARKLVFVGVILTGVGFILMSQVNSVWSLYLIFGLFISIGYNTGFFHATTTATANWFSKKRSRALSFITTGGGFGGAAMVPLLALLITQFGWRWACVAMGVMMLLFGIPLANVIRSRPEDKGLLPDGETVVQTARNDSLKSSKGQAAAFSNIGVTDVAFTVRQALKTQAFWVFAIALMLRACILSSLVVHQIPHLVDMGISYAAAAGCLGSMILISVPGRLLFGWLGDIFDKRYLLLLASLLQTFGIWIFIHADSLGIAYAFVVLFGLGYGGEIPLTLAFRGELFGRKIFATIGGIISSMTAIATVAAPVFAGYLYDVSGSYAIAFYIFMGLITISGFAFPLIRKPKPPAVPGIVATAS